MRAIKNRWHWRDSNQDPVPNLGRRIATATLMQITTLVARRVVTSGLKMNMLREGRRENGFWQPFMLCVASRYAFAQAVSRGALARGSKALFLCVTGLKKYSRSATSKLGRQIRSGQTRRKWGKNGGEGGRTLEITEGGKFGVLTAIRTSAPAAAMRRRNHQRRHHQSYYSATPPTMYRDTAGSRVPASPAGVPIHLGPAVRSIQSILCRDVGPVGQPGGASQAFRRARSEIPAIQLIRHGGQAKYAVGRVISKIAACRRLATGRLRRGGQPHRPMSGGVHASRICQRPIMRFAAPTNAIPTPENTVGNWTLPSDDGGGSSPNRCGQATKGRFTTSCRRKSIPVGGVGNFGCAVARMTG